MFEQSAFSLFELMKQGSRWVVGGLCVVHSANIPLRGRAVLGVLGTLWAMMPVTYVAVILSMTGGSLARENAGAHIFYSMVMGAGAVVSV